MRSTFSKMTVLAVLAAGFALAGGKDLFDMADTQRSIADVLTLLADNTKGQISEQDFRDTVTSLRPSMGNIYFDAASATNLITQGDYVKFDGTTDDGYMFRFSSLGQGDLIYGGVAPCQAQIEVSLSFSGGDAKTYACQIALNGTPLPETMQRAYIPAAGKSARVALYALQELSLNDQLTVHVACLDGTDDPTLLDFVMQAIGHPK